MQKKLIDRVLTFEGASISVGVIGILAGVFAFFVETTTKVSIGWLFFAIWVLLTFLFIFIRATYTINNDFSFLLLRKKELESENKQLERNSGIAFYENPIKFESGSLVIRKNDHFTNQILVAIYHYANDYESIACLGKVVHAQEKLIQIKILEYDFPDKKGFNPEIDLSSYRVRPVVPLYVLQDIIES